MDLEVDAGQGMRLDFVRVENLGDAVEINHGLIGTHFDSFS
jgi:hypothetical protein